MEKRPTQACHMPRIGMRTVKTAIAALSVR